MYSAKDHTFAIIAYKENIYLEKTICSILNQKIKTNVILSTSTPNDYIINLCTKYKIDYVVNKDPKGAGNDWNHGYNACSTPLVTIVHQDDIYNDDYAEKVLAYANRSNDLIIVFTDYYEIRDEEVVSDQLILKVKRIMNVLFRFKIFYKSKFYRRLVLALGDSISCPTVTLNKHKIGLNAFDETFKNSCDYLTWVNLSALKGDFVYVPNQLVGHRIYEESATSQNIADSSRSKEDLAIMLMLWPKWIAKLIHKFYIKAESSNNLK